MRELRSLLSRPAAIWTAVTLGVIATSASLLDAHAFDSAAALAESAFPWGRPKVQWAVSTPPRHGFDSAKLDALRDSLAARRTTAFLVLRGGELVYEWYAPGSDLNKPHSLACLAKATVGSMALMLALDSGRIHLDDHASRYIPEWRSDPVKSTITIRQLACHCAGLDDVNLVVDAQGRLVTPLEGWRSRYNDDSRARFAMALTRSRVIYPPGSEYSYSGMGYYPLAYALAASLKGSETPDVRSLLKRRLMDPMGVPSKAWVISYGEETRLDGLKLFAVGSGAGFTARATARIGQFMLNHGRWGDRQIVDPSWVDAVLEKDTAPPPNRIATYPEPQAALGWWINRDGFWTSLPRDAFLNAGADHQVLLVVPSLDLVVVRFGGPLAGVSWEGTFWTDMDATLFKPIMEAMTPPSTHVAALDEQLPTAF